MPLAPLATPQDLTARQITWTSTTLADTYLAVASAAVRDAAGCPISRTTSTVTLYGDGGPWLRLPGPPIVSVGQVLLDGQPVPAAEWALVDGRLLRPAGWQTCLPQPSPLPSPVQVTYTHGLAQVPADIVDLVCRMAAAALAAAAAEPDGAGLAVNRIMAERLGDYAVTYDPAAGTTEMELADRTRARLRSRFGGLTSAAVSTR